MTRNMFASVEVRDSTAAGRPTVRARPGSVSGRPEIPGADDALFAGILLALVVCVLTGFGLVMLYSTVGFDAQGGGKFLRQGVWVGTGILAALGTIVPGYRRLIHWRNGLYLLICLPLAYLALASVLTHILGPGKVHLPFAVRVKGAFRWIGFGSLRMQPSEPAKTVLILFLAGYYNRNARKAGTFLRGFLLPMGAAGMIVALIFLGHDLSTSVIAAGIAGIMAFVAGVRLRWLAAACLAGAVLVWAAIAHNPERLGRITAFRNPEQHAKSEGFQLWYSQLAIGSGGGAGLGLTRSRMKRLYLPEASTDFILAVVGEELGFMAICGVTLMYLLLVGICCWTAIRAPDREGMLLCSGIAASFALHALVNLSVVSGLAPTTGLTAPFISYGGSSMLMALVDVGLVSSVLISLHRQAAMQTGASTTTAQVPGLLAAAGRSAGMHAPATSGNRSGTARRRTKSQPGS